MLFFLVFYSNFSLTWEKVNETKTITITHKFPEDWGVGENSLIFVIYYCIYWILIAAGSALQLLEESA